MANLRTCDICNKLMGRGMFPRSDEVIIGTVGMHICVDCQKPIVDFVAKMQKRKGGKTIKVDHIPSIDLNKVEEAPNEA